MLNGVDPVIIFHLKKLPPVLGPSGIPVLSSIASAIMLPAIPLYLSEKITGLYIDTEDKNIDVATDIDTMADGSAAQVWQRAIGSTIKVSMKAHRDSIGVSLLSAMADLILPKLTSKEYSITYLHGAVTVFGGLLGSFAINQNASDELYNITLELVKPPPEVKAKAVEVSRNTGSAIDLNQVIIGGVK